MVLVLWSFVWNLFGRSFIEHAGTLRRDTAVNIIIQFVHLIYRITELLV